MELQQQYCPALRRWRTETIQPCQRVLTCKFSPFFFAKKHIEPWPGIKLGSNALFFILGYPKDLPIKAIGHVRY